MQRKKLEIEARKEVRWSLLLITKPVQQKRKISQNKLHSFGNTVYCRQIMFK